MMRFAVAFLALSACTEIGDPALAEYPLEVVVPSGPLSFDQHIKPILVKAGCAGCHTPGGEGEASFDVASADTILEGGDSGPGLVKCDHSDSLIWQRTQSGEMPQVGPHLTQVELDTIAKWIDQGGHETYQASACPDAPLD